jgi:hypothetical protein
MGSETRSKAVQPSTSQPNFLEDVTRTILDQDIRPSYKKARAVIKGAVSSLDEGELKRQLTEQLPSVLEELERALASSSSGTPGLSPEKGPTKKKKRKHPRQVTELVTERAYVAAVEAHSGGQQSLERLFLARVPPHPDLLTRMLPGEGPRTAEAILSASRVCSCSIVAAGCSDVLPVLTCTLPIFHQHLTNLAATLLPTPSTPLSILSTLQIDPNRVTLAQSSAHEACCTCLGHLRAQLALHEAVQASSEAPQLLLRPHAALNPLLPGIHLAFTSACSHICSQLLKHHASTLTVARCRLLVANAASHVSPHHTEAHKYSETAMHFMISSPLTQDARACKPLSSTSQAVAILGWLAVHMANRSELSSARAATPSLAAIVGQRLCAQLYQCAGDAQEAARAVCAFDGLPCDVQLYTWLKANATAPAIVQCVTAARQSGDKTELVVQGLMGSVGIEAVLSTYEHWHARINGTEEEQAAVENAHDTDLFLLDGGGACTAFDGAWAGGSGSRSASDGEEAGDGGCSAEEAQVDEGGEQDDLASCEEEEERVGGDGEQDGEEEVKV